MNPKTYKSGEVAKMAGITIRTLRYYDSIDLLKPSKVLENGHRQYDRKDLEKLQLILGLKLMDFSLEDIKAYLKKPEVNLIDVLKFQKQELIRKIDLYRSIGNKIDFIIEHYREIDSGRTSDIFSLYEMIQVVNHNEIMKKYFPERMQKIMFSGDSHSTHDDLNQALNILTENDVKEISAKDTDFAKKTFIEFISDYYDEVKEETIRKTVRMLAEISAGDVNSKISINENDLYKWLMTNLVQGRKL